MSENKNSLSSDDFEPVNDPVNDTVNPNGQQPKPKFSNPYFSDMAAVVKDQSLIEEGFTRHLTVVKVKRPPKTDFFRVHPSPKMRMDVTLLKDRKDGSIEGDTYYVTGSVVPYLQEGWASRCQLRLCITRAGVIFLWDLKLTLQDGIENDWNKSAFIVADEAEKRWVQLHSNRASGCYEFITASAPIPEPKWPDKPFNEYLDLAFPKNRFINSLQHDVLKNLMGAE